jgi:transcriptional regulator with XRE-family HTH domain
MEVRMKKFNTAEDQEIIKQIGYNLEFVRDIREKTRAEVAKVVGVSTQQIQKYERYGANIPATKIVKLANYLNVTYDKLLPKQGVLVERVKINYQNTRLLRKIAELKPEQQDIIANLVSCMVGEDE